MESSLSPPTFTATTQTSSGLPRMSVVWSTVNGPPITTSGSNHNFPPSLTNYQRRDLQTYYNSDSMNAYAITDPSRPSGSSSFGYPNWNDLQTGTEMDSPQAMARRPQYVESSDNGNANSNGDHGTVNIGNDNSATSRDDSNKADLEGDYVTVRTSVGNTSTRISTKNIKLRHKDRLTDENTGIILVRPKYPRYATLASRVKTFKDSWPVANQTGWEQFPEAGFIYTGTADCVMCYNCDGGLREWLKDACPWTEHARHYPHCPHVRLCKGEDFIRTVRQGTDDAAQTNEEDSDNDVEVAAEAAGNELEAVKVVAEFISDKGLLDRAVFYLKTIQGKASFDATELASVAFEIEEGNIKVDSLPNDESTEVTEESLRTMKDESFDDQETRRLMLEEENRLLKERLICKVCRDTSACVLFLECGHMIACPMCAPALENCTVCRAEIKGMVRVQFATFR